MPDVFDLDRALRDGKTPQAINDYLAPLHGFDLNAARSDKVDEMELAKWLAAKDQPNADERTASYAERFKFQFENSTGMTERAGTWLQAHFPLPEIKIGQDGKLLSFGHPSYSDDPATMQWFDQATPDERIDYYKNMNTQAALENNPDVAAAMERGEDVSAFGAEFVRELLDPASLIAPAGVTIKGMAATSALWGAGYELLEQEYNNKERDFGKIGVAGAFGGLGGAALGKLTKEVPALVRRARQRPGGREHLNQLRQTQSELVDEYIGIMASRSGSNDPTLLSPTSVMAEARKNLGIDENTAADMTLYLDEAMDIPLSPQQAIDAQAAHSAARAGVTGTKTGNKYIDGVGAFIGSMGDKMQEIAPRTYGRLQTYMYNTNVRRKAAFDEVKPFLDDLNKMPKDRRQAMELALFNGDFADAESLMLPSMRNSFQQVRNTLKNQLDELRDSGIEVAEVQSYFPRMVRDHDAYNRAIGVESSSALQKAKSEYLSKINANRESPVTNFNDLTEIQKTDFMNLWVRGFKQDPAAQGLRSTRGREVARIQAEMQDQYLNANDSLVLYLTTTSQAIERAKLFKRAIGTIPEQAGLDESIGRMALADAVDGPAAEDVRRMVGALFGPGEKSPRQTVQFLRNMGYLTTLANPYSAAINMADVGVAKYLGGTDVVPTAMAALAGRSKITLEDLGLGDYITEQLSDLAFDQSKLAKFLGKALEISQFQRFDRLGKETIMNSVVKTHTNAVRTGRGKLYDQFEDKWKRVYGEEDFQILKNDLMRGDITDMVKLHSYNVVSEGQPTSALQMPEVYSTNPNGRFMYALKSFGLRQLNRIYTDARELANKGKKKEAAMKVGAFATFVIGAGASMDMMRDMMVGKAVDINDVPDYFAEGVLRQMFTSVYALEKASSGNVTDLIANAIAPPVTWVNDAGKDMFNFALGTENYVPKFPKNAPLIGKFYDLYVAGGLERANERLTANDPKQGADVLSEVRARGPSRYQEPSLTPGPAAIRDLLQR